MKTCVDLNSCKNNRLAEKEPEFFHLWINTMVDPRDPQLERWIDLASMQIEEGQRNIEHLKTFVDVEGKKVLDLGCQCGHNAIALANAGAQVVGVDVQATYVAGAKVRAKCNGVEANFIASMGEKLPFHSETFDVVYCLNVIEHVANQSLTISEMVRVLKEGGCIYLDGPNRLSPHWLREDPHYQMRGISALPRCLSKFYVTKVRRYPVYEVGHFPIASFIRRRLRQLDMQIVASSCSNNSESALQKRATHSYAPRPLRAFSRWIKFNCDPMFHFFCRKPGGPIEIDFAAYRAAENYVVSGFSHYEGAQRWIDGGEASVRIPCPGPRRDYSSLSIEMFPFIHAEVPFQSMEVSINGNTIGTVTISNQCWQKSVFQIPPGSIEGGNSVEFTFITPNGASPKLIGCGQDSRSLSFLVRRIVIS